MKIAGLSWPVVRALLASQHANMVQYRAEIALWALSGVLPLSLIHI